jgi:hypothetical protein
LLVINQQYISLHSHWSKTLMWFNSVYWITCICCEKQTFAKKQGFLCKHAVLINIQFPWKNNTASLHDRNYRFFLCATTPLANTIVFGILMKYYFISQQYWIYWSIIYDLCGKHGWRSGVRFATVAPGSIPGLAVMWVEFVVDSLPCFEGFSPRSPVFLPLQKSTFLNSNSILDEGHKFISHSLLRATLVKQRPLFTSKISVQHNPFWFVKKKFCS